MSILLNLAALLTLLLISQSNADCFNAYSSKKSSGGIKRSERHKILNLFDDTKGDAIAVARFINDSFQYGFSGGSSKSELLDLVYGTYDALPNKESFKMTAIAKMSAREVRHANESELLCPAGKKAMGYDEILQYARDEVVKKLTNLKD